MELNVLLAIVLSATLFVFVYIIGVLFSFGKCGILIAGYHFEPKGDKAKVYHKYVMRRIGLWFLMLIATVHIGTVCGLLGYNIVSYIFIGVTFAEAIFGLLCFNFNKKIKKAIQMERELSKEFESEEKEKMQNNN